MTSNEEYIGNELELFSHAVNWKAYYGKKLKSYIRGDVLEAGAGIGETTSHLLNQAVSSWTCLEPDGRLLEEVIKKINSGQLPPICRPLRGTSLDLVNYKDLSAENPKPGEETIHPHFFDTILYIDVIEHIEHDGEELIRAKKLLRKGGHLVILVPAHQWLYSPFDKAIGHYRRYNKKRLKNVIPEGMRKELLSYLDSVGLFASLANKFFLRKDYPSLAQIKFWDRIIVPVSGWTDPLLCYHAGKTLVGVWTKE